MDCFPHQFELEFGHLYSTLIHILHVLCLILFGTVADLVEVFYSENEFD